MSWGLTIVGSPVAVSSAVEADSNIPSAVQSLITQQANSIALQPGEVVLVDTNGHFDTAFGGEGHVKVRRVMLAVEPQAAANPIPGPHPPAETPVATPPAAS